MDATQATAVLTDANARMTTLSNQMEQLRAQQLEVLRQAQALANEPGVRQAIATIGTFPAIAKSHYIYVLEGSGTVKSLRLGKMKHLKEQMLPLCDAGDWAASRPSSEAWLIASSPLISSKELFNEPIRTTILGI